ncbi:hypothetical protein TVAG_460590 [Trichomonas vaginalis G3]|uniref:Uncharacterized protein n=1 Tax=Trichomonas vaginalis (strain ATCC PRA-98 / G3) TaxID=412133 RepID=A2DY33_TRIV3|nr:hypothetical protein TVAG_460590 [Trichomonas vaginalis G3]|eukprot:XP_001326865.1 hypothetical protein [Trichomonas vaginalis G3]
MENKLRVYELIDELKQCLISDEVSTSLDKCKVLYDSILNVTDQIELEQKKKELQNEYKTFNELCSKINPMQLYAQSSYSLKELLANIKNVVQNLNKDENIPLNHSDEYISSLNDINSFIIKIKDSINSRTLDQDIFTDSETFENNYFGNYIITLTKTRAEKTSLSSLSVHVGELCTKLRNIRECNNHEAEIEELNQYFNFEDLFMTTEELQKRLAEMSSEVHNNPNTTDSYLNELSSELLKLSRVKIIQNGDIVNINNEPDEYKNLSRKELIDLIKELKEKQEIPQPKIRKVEPYPEIPDPGPLFKLHLLPGARENKTRSLKEKKPTEPAHQVKKSASTKSIHDTTPSSPQPKRKSGLIAPGYLSRRPRVPNTPSVLESNTTDKPKEARKRALSAENSRIFSKIPQKAPSPSRILASPSRSIASPSKPISTQKSSISAISSPKRPIRNQVSEEKGDNTAQTPTKPARPRSRSIPGSPLSKDRFAHLASSYAQHPKKKKSI